MSFFDDAPVELAAGISKYWPEEEWESAALVSKYESGWDAFALDDTTDADHPCGSHLRVVDGVPVAAERSVGYFQVNSCNFPDWEWQRLYNADHNCGTAHMLWEQAGKKWTPWYFTAKQLGLI